VKKIFGLLRVGIRADFKKLRNNQLLGIVSLTNYYSSDQTTSEIGGASGRQGAQRNCYMNSLEEPECKKPLMRPRGGWEDNNKTNFKEID